eukprot:scaffold7275_cov233-Chaetoceros_neogracile.AAC.4
MEMPEEKSLTSCDPNVCPHSIFPALLQLLRSWPYANKVGILNFQNLLPFKSRIIARKLQPEY